MEPDSSSKESGTDRKTYLLLYLVLGLLLFLFIFPHSTSAVDKYELTVNFSDQLGEPVEGQETQILNQQGEVVATSFTDDDGEVEYDYFEKGRYTLRVGKPRENYRFNR